MTREIYQKWLMEAKNDYMAGIALQQVKIYNTAVFHFQQSVEKVLKAALYFFDEQPWGHSIFKLLEHLQKSGKKHYRKIVGKAKEFDMHYTSTRYPDALQGVAPSEYYDEEISKRLMENAKFIMDFVENDFKIVQEEDKGIENEESTK